MYVLAGLMVLRSMMTVSVTIFLPIFLTEEGANVWLAGAALSIVEAAGIAGALAGGWISDHVGRRAVLVFGHIGAPSVLLLFLAADGALRIALAPRDRVLAVGDTPGVHGAGSGAVSREPGAGQRGVSVAQLCDPFSGRDWLRSGRRHFRTHGCDDRGGSRHLLRTAVDLVAFPTH